MSDATPAALAGALRDRYLLERELGRGGMATVWLARDLRHDRLVALKVLRPELSAVLGAERFLREIRLTAKLQHPHILPLHDSGEVPGAREGSPILYYVMPYVDGESLRQRLLRQRQLPLAEALAIAQEVAGALDYAHGEGIVHRDIKPENILLSRDHALVADFGIARAVDAGGERLTETGLAIGTAAYMSPEQAVAQEIVDHRTDIYALGCVLYEMLAGEPPYTGPTAQAVLAKATAAPVPSLRPVRPDIPAAVDQAIGRSLAKSPAARFARAGELVRAASAGPRRRWPALVTALALLLAG
jgi:eukaryotic-like serine/threonine-protein kinase